MERYGGTAEITYLPDRCAWGWTGRGRDETHHEAEETYPSWCIAMIVAGDFLRDHVDPWEYAGDAPSALGDPQECWCWDGDA